MVVERRETVARVKIPVRDGWRGERLQQPTMLGEVGQVSYVEGWCWGVVCGATAAVVFMLVLYCAITGFA